MTCSDVLHRWREYNRNHTNSGLHEWLVMSVTLSYVARQISSVFLTQLEAGLVKAFPDFTSSL